MPKKSSIQKVTSLNDLYNRAASDPIYLELAILGARNLGGGNITTLDQARNWLNTNAMETDEAGVVDEVNFCRDLVWVKLDKNLQSVIVIR